MPASQSNQDQLKATFNQLKATILQKRIEQAEQELQTSFDELYAAVHKIRHVKATITAIEKIIDRM